MISALQCASLHAYCTLLVVEGPAHIFILDEWFCSQVANKDFVVRITEVSFVMNTVQMH